MKCLHEYSRVVDMCEFCLWFNKEWLPEYEKVQKNQNPAADVQKRIQMMDRGIESLFKMDWSGEKWQLSRDEDVRKAQELAKAEMVKEFEEMKPVFAEYSTKLAELYSNINKHFKVADSMITAREESLRQALIDRVFGPQGPPRIANKQKTSN